MRNIPDELRTSWKLLVDVMSKSFRKRSRLHTTPLWSCNTRPMRSTHDPDDDSRLGPDFVECRPRADRSAVARLHVADLEPASLRGRERDKLQGQAADETVPDVLEAREW